MVSSEPYDIVGKVNIIPADVVPMNPPGHLQI